MKKSDIEKLDDFFSAPPTKGQVAWGICHDAGHVVLTHLDKIGIKPSKKLSKMLDKLNPKSTILDLAKVFYQAGISMPSFKLIEEE